MSIFAASPSEPAPVAGEVLKLLGKLARKGAYTKLQDPHAAGAKAYALYSPHVCAAGPIANIGQELIRSALRAGWLESGGEPGTLRLSPIGASALRKARSNADGISGQGRSGGQTRATRAKREGGVAKRSVSPVKAGASPGPTRDEAESPLGWLARRKGKDGNPLIDGAQFDAGERLRADFWYAQMTPRVTACWSVGRSDRRGQRTAPGVGVEIRDSVIAARERVTRALKAVGPELSGVLVDVCCHLKGLELAEREAGWPQRSGKIVLIMALSALARHYGMGGEGAGERAGARRSLHWGAQDYRPTIDGD